MRISVWEAACILIVQIIFQFFSDFHTKLLHSSNYVTKRQSIQVYFFPQLKPLGSDQKITATWAYLALERLAKKNYLDAKASVQRAVPASNRRSRSELYLFLFYEIEQIYLFTYSFKKDIATLEIRSDLICWAYWLSWSKFTCTFFCGSDFFI